MKKCPVIACVTANMKERRQSATNIMDLPSELIALILANVDPPTLVQSCSLVCSRFHSVISAPNFWCDVFAIQHGLANQMLLNSKLPPQSIDYRTIVIYQLFERNLVINPSGEARFNFWEIKYNGGSGMIVESSRSLSMAPGSSMKMTLADMQAVDRPAWLEVPSKSCFATSYEKCKKYQVVDLVECGFTGEFLDTVKPPIAVGEWTGTCANCGSEYQLAVKLFDQNNKLLDKFTKSVIVERFQGGFWVPIHHTFQNYPTGVRKVIFRHSGSDKEGLRGHFGAKFANATVKVLFTAA